MPLSFDPVIYINVRDRLNGLRQQVDWLERAGHQRLVLLDNDSSYPPLLDYLAATPHQVRRLGRNLGSRAIWQLGPAPRDWFVYTDPDIVPIETCPPDALQFFRDLLDRHPGFPKAGFGLYLDDCPIDLHCRQHESTPPIRGDELEPNAYRSLIDTTFALYRPGTGFCYDAIRTGGPYQARHLPWYRAFEPDAEERYYLERATAGPLGSSWAEMEVLR